MRRFFEPATAPAWLKPVLTSLRAALGDIWDVPLRLKDYATADLPAAADFAQGLVYDRTAVTVKWSDGTSWNGFQPADAQLAAIASLAPAADQIAYWTGATTAALAGFTAFGRSLVDDADAAAGRTTLGLGTAATRNTGTSGTTVPLLDGVNSWSGAQTFGPAAAAAINVSGNRSLASWGAAGPNLRVQANTLTDTSTAGGGTVSVQGANSFGTPTLAATSSGVTITNGVTLYIAGPPAAGTNVTIANPWALYVNTGNVRIGGNLTYTGAGTFGTSVGDSHLFNGQATFVESAGAAITLKDSNSSGTAAAVEMSIVDQDNALVARIGMESSANDDLYVHSVAGIVRLMAADALQATVTTDGINLVAGNWYAVNGTQVVAARKTGWSADTGTASRAAQATYAGTAEAAYTQATIQALMDAVQNLSRTQKALKDDLIAHGLIGA